MPTHPMRGDPANTIGSTQASSPEEAMLENHPVISLALNFLIAIPFAVTVVVMLLGGTITITIP